MSFGDLLNNVEAAARAAQEAARRAAEEAARRAAAEAAKQAAQAAANQEAAAARSEAMSKAAQEGDTATVRAMRMEQMDGMSYGDAPWDAEDRAAEPEAAKRLEQGVSLQDLKDDPQLAKDVAALATNSDPKVRAMLDGAAKTWVQEGLAGALANGKGQDPKAVFDGFKSDIQAFGASSGLGPVLSKQAETAVKDQAVALLNSKPSMKELTENPAKGQLIGMLAQDPVYKGQVEKMVKGFAQGAIDKHLEGKEKESGVKDAVDQTTKDMVAFAKATGMGDVVKNATNDAFKASKDKFEDTAKKGRSMFDRFTGLAGDFFGGIGDLLGKGIDALGDVAEGAFDVAGDLTEGLADITASGLDAVGANGAADFTRDAGHMANATLDKTGQIANEVGDVVAVGLEDGATGIANKAMQAALGDQKPEYKDEIGGVTGAITNRLGKGDSVYVSVSGGATVGVGVYGTMSASAEAQLSRNDDGTISLTLEGEVKGGGGVSAKTGAKGEAEVGDMKGKAGAEADASAEANAKVNGRMVLTFDPKNPADVARLQALIEPDVGKLAAAATNPLAALAIGGSALADAVEHNKTSYTVGGAVGVEGHANASAGVGPVSAEVGADASAVLGGAKTFNSDGSSATTVYMAAGASVHMGISAGPASIEAGAGVKAALGMTIERDAHGNVTGVSTEHGVNASASASAKVDGPAKAGGGHSETSKVTERLTPAGVAEFNRLAAEGKNPIDAYTQARKNPANIQEVKSTTSSDEFSIGGGGEVALVGIQVGLKGKVTLGKSHTDQEVISGPTIIDNQLNQNFTLN